MSIGDGIGMSDSPRPAMAAPGATPTAAAGALVTAVGTGRPAERQMREAGLQVIGSCERLSARWPGLLRNSELLQDFTPAEADVLGLAMLLVQAHPGQRLIDEDQPGSWAILLLSGTVDVVKRHPEAPVQAQGDAAATTRLAVVREGASLGEMSMLDGEPRYASCIALDEVQVGVIDREGVAWLITHHPGVGAKLLVKFTQLLAQRLRTTSNQLVQLLRERREGSPAV